MDEKEFQRTHRSVNETPCVFAKALLRRCAGCSRSRKLLIAERETMACNSPAAHLQCETLLGLLREKALFALQIREADGPLPHGKEIKVQCGGLQGLRALLDAEAEPVEDVHELVVALLARYGSLEPLPYSEVVRAVVHFQSRKRGSRG